MAASVCMAVSRRVWLHVCLFNYVVSAYMSVSSTVDVWRLSTCLLPYLYPLSPVVGYIVKHMGSENTVQEDREKKPHTFATQEKFVNIYNICAPPLLSALLKVWPREWCRSQFAFITIPKAGVPSGRHRNGASCFYREHHGLTLFTDSTAIFV